MSVTVNAQQEAVAFWKFLQSRGIQPSVRRVVAMMRAAMIPIDDRKARGYLAAFAAAAPHPKAIHYKITARTPQPDGTPATQTQHSGDSDEALARGVKVSLSTKIEPTAPTLDLGLELVKSSPLSQPVQVRAPQADRRSPAEQIADAALSEVRPAIEGALAGMTWTTWRTRNRKAVVDMARSGMTADEIVAAHEEASEARGGTAMVMAWVQERVVRQAATATPVSAKQAEVDNLPSVANGAAGTKPWDIPGWERPPNHPRYYPHTPENEARFKHDQAAQL